MNNISSKTLFHFTSKIDYLFNILIDGFYPRYCLERLPFYTGQKQDILVNFDYAFPMVCFCDIPFSKIYNHTINYGRYGIGMKKDWAMKLLMKINPVMYYYPHSFTGGSHMFRINILNDLIVDYPDEERLKLAYGSTFQFFNFLKPYEGQFWRNGKLSSDKVNFYNEREWRFTAFPGYLSKMSIPQYLKKDDFLNDKLKESYNKLLEENCTLFFKSSDVKYILVENDNEIPLVTEKLKQEFVGERLDEPIEQLYTKILSLETFEKDV